jgi:hypothetical protein
MEGSLHECCVRCKRLMAEDALTKESLRVINRFKSSSTEYEYFQGQKRTASVRPALLVLVPTTTWTPLRSWDSGSLGLCP